MPKGLYFTAVVSFFLLFWSLISDVTEHIHLWLLFPNLVWTPRAFTPHGLGVKKPLSGTNFELWLNIFLQRNMISTIGKKLVNLQGLPYMPPNLVNFSPKRLRRVGEFLPTLYIFALGDTASLTAWTLYNRQQANFGMCYVVARAYSLEQQNAGRAHAGLCHAHSSFLVFALL